RRPRGWFAGATAVWFGKEHIGFDNANPSPLLGRQPQRRNDLRFAEGRRPLALERDLLEPPELLGLEDLRYLRLLLAGQHPAPPARNDLSHLSLIRATAARWSSESPSSFRTASCRRSV